MFTAEKQKLVQEISTWKYLSTTLTQEHQQNIKSEILAKVDNLKLQLKELNQK